MAGYFPSAIQFIILRLPRQPAGCLRYLHLLGGLVALNSILGHSSTALLLMLTTNLATKELSLISGRQTSRSDLSELHLDAHVNLHLHIGYVCK